MIANQCVSSAPVVVRQIANIVFNTYKPSRTSLRIATCPVRNSCFVRERRRGTSSRTAYTLFFHVLVLLSFVYVMLRNIFNFGSVLFVSLRLYLLVATAIPQQHSGTDASSSCHNFILVSAPLFLFEMNTEEVNNCKGQPAFLEEGQGSSSSSSNSNNIDKRSRRRPAKIKDDGEKAATMGVNQENEDEKKTITSYCIRYENNASKRWDGKELLVDKDWLDELDPDIYTGKQIQLPWTGKKGKTVLWNAVVVELDNSQKPSPKKQHLEPTKPKQRKQSGKNSSKKDKGDYC